MMRLVRSVPEKNVHRFYLIQVVPGLLGNWGVLREWGRVGQAGTVRHDWHPTEVEAINAAHTLLKVKQNRGYVLR
jgi:predicted DNA-binding WGR domain protein